MPQRQRRVADVCPNLSWYAAKSPWLERAAKMRARIERGRVRDFGA